MRRLLRRLFRESSPGQSLIEYALILMFVAVAAFGIFDAVANGLGNAWDSAGGTIDNAGTTVTADGGSGGGSGGNSAGGASGTGGFHHDHTWWHGWGNRGGGDH